MPLVCSVLNKRHMCIAGTYRPEVPLHVWYMYIYVELKLIKCEGN